MFLRYKLSKLRGGHWKHPMRSTCLGCPNSKLLTIKIFFLIVLIYYCCHGGLEKKIAVEFNLQLSIYCCGDWSVAYLMTHPLQGFPVFRILIILKTLNNCNKRLLKHKVPDSTLNALGTSAYCIRGCIGNDFSFGQYHPLQSRRYIVIWKETVIVL